MRIDYEMIHKIAEAARKEEELRVAPELLDFKFRSMKARGFLLSSPIYATKNYMDKSL